MFDIAFTEMMVLAVIIVLVVGPKDLPKVMRTVGGWVRKARGMAREFQGGIEQIARETELDELRKGADQLKNFDPNKHLEKSIDPTGGLAGDLAGDIARDVKGDITAPAKGGDGGGAIGSLSDDPAPAPASAPAPTDRDKD